MCGRFKESEIIKPILRGRDIGRYSYKWADLWILFVPWHFPLNHDPTIQGASSEAEIAFQKKFPAVYKHLLGYKDVLSKRNQAETGIRYEWYALQRCAATYFEELEKEKIVWASVGNTEYSLIPKRLMLLDTNYFTTVNDLFVYGVLNSKLITVYVNSKDVKVGSKAYRHYKYNFEAIPIIDVTQEHKEAIISLVKEIMSCSVYQDNAGVDSFANMIKDKSDQIDKLVYQLYELTADEIEIIEKEMEI